MDKTMTTEAPAAEEMPQDTEGSPLDEMIGRVDSYMRDPKLVTPDTLGQLKADLEDLKSYVDGGTPDEAGAPMASGDNGGHGLSITIGKMRGGK